jgi:MHS family proline/betaine transporter-like MFS transporter
VFVVEYAPVGRRGWYGGWIWATLALGLAAATGTATLLAWWLPPAMVEAWAWRLAFLALVAAASLSFNTSFIYLPNHLVTERGVPLSWVLAGALLGLVIMGAAAPAFGWLSDQVGRRPLLAAATFALLGLTLPIHLLVRRGGPVGLPVGYLVLGAILGCFVLPSFLSELFPTRVRFTGLAITYGLGSAMFGGTAPLVDTLLVARTGNPLLPAYYAAAVALLAAIGVLMIRETAFHPLDPDHR